MSIQEVFELLKTLGTTLSRTIPVAYDHFTSKVSPPCIVFCVDRVDTFYADDRCYYAENRYQVILTTDVKDVTVETSLESIFDANNISYEKQEAFIDTELMYQIIYNI